MNKDNVNSILKSIPDNVTLVAATKYIGVQDMTELLGYGINNFGENRVESFLEKYDKLQNKNIIWHFIGHLQTNKAKDVIGKIDYLHSLDSLKLVKLIQKNRITPLNVFLEINLLNQENKNGVKVQDIDYFIKKINECPMINLIGLMMMGDPNKSKEETGKDFNKLYLLKENLNKEYNLNMKYLSMGMSDDYKEALKNHATHIRLGRILLNDFN